MKKKNSLRTHPQSSQKSHPDPAHLEVSSRRVQRLVGINFPLPFSVQTFADPPRIAKYFRQGVAAGRRGRPRGKTAKDARKRREPTHPVCIIGGSRLITRCRETPGRQDPQLFFLPPCPPFSLAAEACRGRVSAARNYKYS